MTDHDRTFAGVPQSLDFACSPTIDYTSRRLVAAARTDGPESPVRIPALTESIRSVADAAERDQVAGRVMQLIAPTQVDELRASLAQPDPHAAHRPGAANASHAAPWEGIRLGASVNAGGREYERSLSIGTTEYPNADVPAGDTRVIGRRASVSSATESGACQVSVPSPIPGVDASLSRTPSSDPTVRDGQWSAGLAVSAGPFSASVTVGLGPTDSVPLEGSWMQRNDRGEPVRSGRTDLERATGPFGQRASGTTTDNDGNASRFTTQVDPRQRAEALVNPAWTDGRSARPAQPAEPPQAEPGFLRRNIVDPLNRAVYGAAAVEEDQRRETHARDNSFLRGALSDRDRGLYDRIRESLPRDTPPATVAHGTLLARQAGIHDASDLRQIALLDGNRAALAGSYPGSHAMLDLSARPPSVGETVQSLQTVGAPSRATIQSPPDPAPRQEPPRMLPER